jgi:peptidyl-tRNA hydrolase, PTH1 family
MILLYGLGNNESKYLTTKHNAGRIVLEQIATLLGLNFQKKGGFWYSKQADIALLYSDGYMNHSGQVLSEFCNYFKLNPDILLVLQDDSDQLCGNQKLLPGGGTAGHNGIASIYQHLTNTGLTKETIWRLKIGIRPTGNTLKSETFVLNSLNTSDLQHLDKISHSVFRNLAKINPISISLLQNELNGSLE